MLIVNQNLKFACDPCVRENKESSCTHVCSIEEGLVYAVCHGFPNTQTRLRLVTAMVDPYKNPICPHTRFFCFDCPNDCCTGFGTIYEVFLSTESVVTELEVDNRLIFKDAGYTLTKQQIKEEKRSGIVTRTSECFCDNIPPPPLSAASTSDSLFDNDSLPEEISTGLTIPPDNVIRASYFWDETRNRFIASDGSDPW